MDKIQDMFDHHDRTTTKLVQVRDELKELMGKPKVINSEDLTWLHDNIRELIDNFLDTRLDLARLAKYE